MLKALHKHLLISSVREMEAEGVKWLAQVQTMPAHLSEFYNTFLYFTTNILGVLWKQVVGITSISPSSPYSYYIILKVTAQMLL